jgi:hypothetical protein
VGEEAAARSGRPQDCGPDTPDQREKAEAEGIVISTYTAPVFALDVMECPLCLRNLYPNEKRGKYLGRIAHLECSLLRRLDEIEAEQSRQADTLEQVRERVSGIAGREKI